MVGLRIRSSVRIFKVKMNIRMNVNSTLLERKESEIAQLTELPIWHRCRNPKVGQQAIDIRITQLMHLTSFFHPCTMRFYRNDKRSLWSRRFHRSTFTEE